MNNEINERYKQRCENIAENVSCLRIVKRRIFDDKFASFSLRRDPESKKLLGPIEVTILPNGHLVVTGDYETCVFARYSGDHWRGAIHWIGRSSSPTGYICEKAQAGMGLPVMEIKKEQLERDLMQMLESEEIDQTTCADCLHLIRIDDYGDDGTHAMWEIVDALHEANVEAECFEHIGEVPTIGVIAAVAVLHHLDQLLAAEEAAEQAKQEPQPEVEP